MDVNFARRNGLGLGWLAWLRLRLRLRLRLASLETPHTERTVAEHCRMRKRGQEDFALSDQPKPSAALVHLACSGVAWRVVWCGAV